MHCRAGSAVIVTECKEGPSREVHGRNSHGKVGQVRGGQDRTGQGREGSGGHDSLYSSSTFLNKGAWNWISSFTPVPASNVEYALYTS